VLAITFHKKKQHRRYGNEYWKSWRPLRKHSVSRDAVLRARHGLAEWAGAAKDKALEWGLLERATTAADPDHRFRVRGDCAIAACTFGERRRACPRRRCRALVSRGGTTNADAVRGSDAVLDASLTSCYCIATAAWRIANV